MPVEIERKFLVRGDAWRPCVSRTIRMVQGYLGGDRCSLRIRIEGDEARLNIKSKTKGMRRAEYEYPIPRAEADELLRDFGGALVSKQRHHVVVDGTLFEIDEFDGDNAGLIVAEVELDDESSAFPQPGWLGEEVTDERRYYNVALAEAPFSRWPDRAEILAATRKEGAAACS